MNACLLLTATIKVHPACPFVGLRNTKERIKDYKAAFDWWFDNFKGDIVFCENSGHPIDFIPNSPRVEVIQWNFDCVPELEKGKGRGEAAIFEKAYRESKLLQKHEIHMKCSGRYTMHPGAFELLDVMQNNHVIAITCTHSQTAIWNNSGCWFLRPEFYHKYFKLQALKIDDRTKFYMEKALRMAINDAVGHGELVGGHVIPIYGRSGTNTKIDY